jgi:zinc protease
MKHLITLALLASLPACQLLSTTGGEHDHQARKETERVFPYEVHQETLDNGLTVLMMPMPSDGLVSYWSVVRTGSRDEVEEGVTGFAHFFEHMMFRGTEKRPGKVYDGIVHGMGADANAFTTDDYTAYHLSVGRKDLPTVIEIEADRFQNLAYDEPAFRTEAGAVFGEYRKGRSSPFEVLFEAMQEKAFDRHTYKHTTIGFVRDIERMPEQYAYSKTFFQRFYRPENVVLTIAGDFDRAETMQHIRAQYGGWKRGYQAPSVPAEPEQQGLRRIDVPFDGQTQPIVTLNFKSPAFAPQDSLAVAGRVAADIWFGETSPLYRRLVIEEQRCEFVAASFENTRDPGLWTVYAMVKNPADVRAVENELWKEIELATRTAPTQARLDAVRSNLRYAFLAGLTTPDAVSQAISRFVAHTGNIACIDQWYTTLKLLKPDDIAAGVTKYLRRERCTVATVHTKDAALPAVTDLPRPRSIAAPAQAARLAMESAHVPTMPTGLTALVGDAQLPSLPQPPVLLAVPADPTVSFQLWFQVGSQDDPVGQEGLTALTAAMMTEGATQQRSYPQLLEALYPMAGTVGASTDREQVLVRGRVHKDNAAAFADLLVEIATKSAFQEADFQRLRDRAVSSIENDLRYASGEDTGKAALMERVFRGTRYAHPELGTVESLKRLTLDDVRRFARTHFTRERCVLGMGGSFTQPLVARVSGALAAGLPTANPERTPAPQPAPLVGRPVVLIDNPSAIGSSISMGVPISARRGTREFVALWIANSWLGEHRNSGSHLYQVIREERGINYGNYSYIEAYPNGGRLQQPPQGVSRRAQLFEIWIRTVPPERTLFALRAALREVELLHKNGLTQEQFEATRAFLKGYTLHFAESTAARLGYAIDDRFYGIDGHLAQFQQLLDQVTLDEVNQAVRKHMSADNLAFAIVTNDAANLKVQLSEGKSSPITYGAGQTKPEFILAEDKLIADWPLRIQLDTIELLPIDALFQK